MNKNIIILLICSVFLCCKTTLVNTNVKGKYILKTPHSEITIKSNGGFYYRSFQGLIEPTSDGYWELKEGNKLILNSKNKYKSGYIEQVKSVVNHINKSVITVFDGENNLNKNGIIYINDNPKEEFKLNNDGKVELDSKLNSISVLTLDGYYTLKLDSENYYDISVIARHEEVNDKFFENEIFIFKKSSLISESRQKYIKE